MGTGNNFCLQGFPFHVKIITVITIRLLVIVKVIALAMITITVMVISLLVQCYALVENMAMIAVSQLLECHTN